MNLPRKQAEIINLRDGIDLATPLVRISPGAALDLYNFEPELEGGYRRIAGYERCDGRAAPSDGRYSTLGVADGSVISVDSDITGGTSGATARVVIKDGDVLGITAIVGDFEVGEAVGGTTITVAPILQGRDDIEESDTWQLAAEDYYRSLIQAVPGDGDVLGAVQYLGSKYAFRADSGAVKLYKSSASGWTLVPFYDVLFFDGGTLSEGDITEGTSITGATSGAAATVKAFIKNAGSYDDTNASGYMVVDVTSGTFQDDENIQVGGVTKAVADGANTAVGLSDGGKFRFTQHNFFGSSSTYYLFGADGVNPAFQFDGDVLTPIYFPAPDENPSWNTPKYLVAHKGHLFLSFPGGSLAHSSIGEPLVFSALLGAAEFGLGDDCTGLAQRAGDLLAIYTRSMTFGLYGTSSADWNLKVISETFGAKDDTVQKIGTVYALDDKGIAPLERVEAYGDFESSTISRLVKPILDTYRNRIIGSVVIKDRNQYRLFFDDGTALVMGDDQYTGESLPAFSTLDFKHTPTCLSASQDDSGDEVILFGASDGYVYQMERGYNFDGQTVPFAFRSPFLHQRSPYIRKSYRRLFVDVETGRNVSFSMAAELAYGDYRIPSNRIGDISISGGGGYYNVDNWNEIFWDAPPYSSQGIPLTGTGYNVSILVYGDSATVRPFTLQTFEVHYLPRRIKRG